MRLAVAMAMLTLVMSACSKQDSGYVYKCEYNVRGKWYNAANYFIRPTQDLASAEASYKTSEAYADIKLASDSIWFEYYCTYDEWKNK